MIDWLSNKVTCYLIDNGHLENEDYSEFDYSFRIIFSNLLAFALVFLLSVFFNVILEFLIGYFMFNFMRLKDQNTFHSKSVDACFVFMIPIFSSQILLAKYLTLDLLFIIIIGLMLLYFIKENLSRGITIITLLITIVGLSKGIYYNEIYDIIGITYVYILILNLEIIHLIMGYYDKKLIRFLNRYFKAEEIGENEQ